jgi:hypothetical protein
MVFLRVVCMSIFAMVCAERLPAQTAASVPQPASSQPSSDSHSIALTIPDGTPLQIALDKEVRVQKVGQPIHGHVMQPSMSSTISSFLGVLRQRDGSRRLILSQAAHEL